MDIFDVMDLDAAIEDLDASMERSYLLNRHNITAFGDQATRKEFYITFDGKTKKKVKFVKSFVGAMDEFVKRECSQGKPEPVSKWIMVGGPNIFKNNAWYKKMKDKPVYVWTYWTAGNLVASLLINPLIMQAIDPIDYRRKPEEREVDHKCSMHKSTLYNCIHKANALLSS